MNELAADGRCGVQGIYQRGSLLNEDPFTHLNIPTPEQRAAWLDELARQGVRLLPPPFGHGVAVLSDIDDSDRERSGLYHGQLIEEHGLDFGDSMWLFGRTAALLERDEHGLRRVFTYPGQALGHPCGDPDAWTGEDLVCIRSSREMIVGALRGDFDHFHAFMPTGHRLVWLKEPRVEGCDAIFAIGDLQRQGYFRTTEMRAAGLAVVGMPETVGAMLGAEVDGRALAGCGQTRKLAFVPDREGRSKANFGAEHEDSAWLVPVEPIGPGNPLPHLWLTDEIRIHCNTPEAAVGVRAVGVTNATRPLILGRLRELDERWNLRTSLITEHSGYCFLNQKSWAFHSARVARESETASKAPRGWVIGIHNGPDRFSGLADDPQSFVCLFPELSAELGFRFVNAGGLTGSPNYSFDATNVVAPSLVRDGSGVYICRRTMPTLPDGVDPEDPVLKATRAPSFGLRLRKMYELMAENPGRLWPIYTHLGGIQPLEETPVPYLEQEPVRQLQDRVYNMSGTVKPADRVWFVRGTGLC